MIALNRDTYTSRLMICFAISVIAWVAFAGFFTAFWPGQQTAGSTVFWLWLLVAFPAIILATILIFRLMKIPRAMAPAAAAALSAPALCLDVLTTTFFETWVPHASVMDDRAYAAMVLGGVGFLLFTGLAVGRTKDAA
ncbi:MAG: DUF5367 family protein [Parvibaculum sp.]